MVYLWLQYVYIIHIPLYLLGVNVDLDYRITMIPNVTLVIANKLRFLPTCVDQFIHIAFPFPTNG